MSNRRNDQTCTKSRAWTLTELLVIVATIGVLAAILFPVFRQKVMAYQSSAKNVRKIANAAIQYGDDWDERIPLVANGTYRNLKNTADGVLTAYGEKRADLWPLILMPYIRDRSAYVDPSRKDAFNIFSKPAMATTDAGYDPYGPTYRNQNRFPFFGMNYQFLSPFLIPSSKMADPTPTDFMVAEVHRFFQADDPEDTVFFAPTWQGRIPSSPDDKIGKSDVNRGYFALNAPGLWPVMSMASVPYIAQWTGAVCSGDWCGADIDPATPGVQQSQSYFYEDPKRVGNNTAFLDGHVKFMKTLALAAGTNYLTATPSDGGSGAMGGGANIVDKTKYIWNLDNNYYGA